MSTGHVLRSSIFRKQIVAITGLMMVGFIITHLAANMLIFFGPEALNGYTEVLHTLPELLWVARLALIGAVVAHVYFTILLFRENRQSGGAGRYAVQASRRGDISIARRFMILTGGIVFFFLFVHINDFTIADKTGIDVEIEGTEYGLYGLVWNSFKSSPLRVLFYVAAVCCVGMHLTHGIQSLFQSVGFNHERWTPLVKHSSIALGVIIALGFSIIPIYILIGQPNLH